MSNKRTLAKLLLAGQLLGLTVVAPGFAQTTTSTTGTATVFSDVSTETKYEEAIKYLRDNQIVQGYPDGSFGPSKNINRAEFAKILMGAISGEKLTGKNCFPDVTDQWFAPYVCSAKSMGLLDGYPDGNFKPEEQINFAEAAKIIANAFKLNKGEKDPTLWFKEYIEALQKENAIPLSVEYFDEKITRDEMSEIIWRVKADVNDKASRTYLELQGEGLVKANSCSDLEDRFKELQQPYPIYRLYDAPMPVMAPASEQSNGAAANESKSMDSYAGASGDYSTTNVQVEGVDEADVIKNDGKFIYLIKGNTVRIIQAFPANEMKELVSFQLGKQEEYFYPNEMYVTGNQLIVMGTGSVTYPMPMAEDTVTTDAKMIAPYYGGSKSKVYIVDISDRSKPKVTRTVDFDGNYNTSRRIDNTLYLVLNQYPYFPYYSGYNKPIENFSEYLPRMSDSARDGKIELASPCDQIRIMPKPRNFNFLITAAIPLADNRQAVSRSVLVGSSENVYASEKNLYIASTDWTGPYYFRAESDSSTKLYRFALSNSKLEYQAEGVVPGTVLNQFSMDEFRNNFRIATTKNQYDSGEQSNNLYVLDQSLKTIGKVENLAPGEKIYSVRFMGDRAYMVTFKYVDPLFVIELKDPTKPVIAGYLKIPGYSDYLHPYDETHVIGFGKDVDPKEVESEDSFVHYTAVRGFKMALFDVADTSKPKELFHEVIGDQGTYSELLYNHKALLFNKEKNLIAFPISVTEMPKDQGPVCSEFTYSNCPSTCNKVCQPKCTYENGITICDNTCDGASSCQQATYVYPKTVFIGAYVYGVDLQNGFKLKAKITHLNSEDIDQLLKDGWTNAYEKTIQRILYIGDTLYTVSQGAVKANSLSDSLRELKMVELSPTNYNLYYGG
ncbi:beta-propeller domain-containing protein [Candidatus Peregrinibacteria bacterium]|nr:beta-propeller domain-containing protein [Candidatus Peregrinibacteria bacterium]